MIDSSLPRWVLMVALAALVIVPTVLAALGKGASIVWPVALACMAAVLLIRLPDVEMFKAGPLEARMRRATEKAEATIDQLQQLAAKLSAPILRTMAATGRWDSATPRKESLDFRDEIVAMLRALGVNSEAVQLATKDYNQFIETDLLIDLQRIVAEETKSDEQAVAAVAFLSNGQPLLTVRTADDIRARLSAVTVLTPNMKDALDDLQQFQRDQTLRRRGVFIGRETR